VRMARNILFINTNSKFNMPIYVHISKALTRISLIIEFSIDQN